LIDVTPRLRDRLRAGANTLLAKEFRGGILVLTGANSAVGLRSMPARWLLLDEIDGYPGNVDNEGDPIALAEARQRTFARRKRLKVSTPTFASRSRIEAAYEASDQRRYYVPCPECGEQQPLEFARLMWSKRDRPPEQAAYECRACLTLIEEHHKTMMLAQGEWRPERPEADPRVRGYHLSALYSPVGWLSWGDIALDFVAVPRDPERHRVFINTVLGETWQDRGEAPDWGRLMRRREVYAMGTVPAGALFLTAGVDVQKDRLVYEVVGWGRGKTSWSVDYGILPGDTADLDQGPWPQLDALLARTFPHDGGVELAIRMLAVDSGYNTQQAYAWARRYPMNRVIAVKGQAMGGALIGPPTPVDVSERGRRLKRSYKVWPVVGGIAKSELYGWLRLELPVDGGAAPAGFAHFPEYDESYFRELTAEQLVTRKTAKGFLRMEWELIPGRQNHALDCRVYARAAAAVLGLDRFHESDWAALEKAIGQDQAAPPPGPAAPAAAAAPRAPAAPVRRAPPGGSRGVGGSGTGDET
jgi:phage terminase large subunit GpA-like protein